MKFRLLLTLLFSCCALQGAGNQFNTYDWEARDWAKVRVVAKSSSVSGASYQKVTHFVLGLKQMGLRSYLKEVGVYAGDDINALKAPLFTAASGTYVINNFVSGDFTEATGLTGNTTSKSIDSGGSLNSAGASSSDIHLSAYVRTGSAENSLNLGISVTSGSTYDAYIAVSAVNNSYGVLGSSATGAAVVSDASGVGFYSASRTSSAATLLYKNGVQIATTTLAPDGNASLPTGNMIVHAYNGNGTIGAWCSRAQSYYSWGPGLTAAQELAYYRLVQRLQTWFNRHV